MLEGADFRTGMSIPDDTENALTIEDSELIRCVAKTAETNRLRTAGCVQKADKDSLAGLTQ